jgi:hypothetical protein
MPLRTLPLLSLLATASQAGAQVTVEPGSPALRMDRLTAGVDSFRIESSFGNQKRASTMVRSVERSRLDGRDVLVFAQRYHTPQGITVDTSWVDARTLAPLRYFAEVYGEIQVFTFDGRTGSGTVTPKDSASRPVSITNATPFFNAVALDLLYRALPWSRGFAASAVLYNPPRASFTVSLRVTGEEELPLAAGGTVKAWVVDYALGPGRQTLWVDQSTGEFLRIGGTQGENYFWKYRLDLSPPNRLRGRPNSS